MRLTIVTLLAFAMMLSCGPNSNQVENDDTQDAYSTVDADEEEALGDVDTHLNINETRTDETEDLVENSESASNNYTEAKTVEVVVKTDTIATNIAYDVNRRTIEQVDTVSATKTYEVTRKIVKKKILVDTITETISKEQQIEFEKGDYKVLNEKVVQDTVMERIDHTINPATKELEPSDNQNAQIQPTKNINPNKPSSTKAETSNERKTPSYEPVQSDTSQANSNNS